jgi:hypothetical protein
MTLPAEPPSNPLPTEVAATATITPAECRRATISVATGSLLEYFDFIIYWVFTVYFAPLVFHANNPASALLQSAAVFGGPADLVALTFTKVGFPVGHFILMAVFRLGGTVVALVIRKRLAAGEAGLVERPHAHTALRDPSRVSGARIERRLQ